MKLALFILLSMVLSAQAPTVLTGNSVVRNAVISAPAPAGNDPVFNNLTHYWSMDEASGTRVDSKGSINLGESGGVVNSASGKDGNAANYNTAGHYLKMNSNLGGNPHFMAFWLNIRNLPGVGQTYSLVGDGFNNDYCQLDNSGNVSFEDDLLGGGVDPVISIALGALNAWHLIVIGDDPLTQLEYISVDGSSFVTGDVSSGSGGAGFATDDRLTFGASTPSASTDGLFDECMVFNTQITQANVTTLWNGGAGKFYRP